MGAEPVIKSLFDGAGPASQPNKVQPPPSLFGTSVPCISGTWAPNTSTTNEPKSLFSGGVKRKRIEVDISDLEKFSDVKNVLEKSKEQILTTNVDELNITYVLNWGASLQERHAELLEKMMTLVNHPDILSAKTSLLRLLKMIDDIDVKNVFKKSLFTSKDDKRKIVLLKLEELKILSDSMRKHTKLALDDIRKLSEELITDIRLISTSLEPYIVTCQFFSEYQKDDFPKELYISRLYSLLSTKTDLVQNEVVRSNFNKTIINLMEIVQNVCLTDIPKWYSNYLNLIASDSDSGVVDMETQKSQIISKLKNI